MKTTADDPHGQSAAAGMTGARREPASVLIAGINYDTDALAVRFARSAAALAPPETLAITIVDNSEPAPRSTLRAELSRVDPRVRYLRAPRNLGYFGGAALAAREHVAVHGWPDWLIVSNVDVEFRDRDFLRRLLSMSCPSDVAVVAPSIWSAKSLRDLNPQLRRRPRRATMKFYKAVFANFYTLNLYELASAVWHVGKHLVRRLAGAVLGRVRRDDRRVDGRRTIYAPHGACIIFAREYFVRGGTLNYPSFLFGEEIYVAETARELGVAILYEPQLRLWHDDHASTGLVRPRHIAAHVGRSARFIADRYFK